MAARARLHTRLLVSAEHAIVRRQRLTLPLPGVPVQHTSGRLIIPARVIVEQQRQLRAVRLRLRRALQSRQQLGTRPLAPLSLRGDTPGLPRHRAPPRKAHFTNSATYLQLSLKHNI